MRPSDGKDRSGLAWMREKEERMAELNASLKSYGYAFQTRAKAFACHVWEPVAPMTVLALMIQRKLPWRWSLKAEYCWRCNSVRFR